MNVHAGYAMKVSRSVFRLDPSTSPTLTPDILILYAVSSFLSFPAPLYAQTPLCILIHDPADPNGRSDLQDARRLLKDVEPACIRLWMTRGSRGL